MPKNHPLLLTALLTLVLVCSSLAATDPSVIFVTKTFAYRQTSAATVVQNQPSIEVFVEFAKPPADSVQMEIKGTDVNSGFVLPLARQTSLANGTTRYVVTRQFSSLDQLNVFFPNGHYTVTLAGDGLTRTFDISALFFPPVSIPKMTNFDALQSWDGRNITATWTQIQPFPFTITSGPPFVDFEMLRADGTVVFSFPFTFGPDGQLSSGPIAVPANGFVSAAINGVSSAAGEIFDAKLSSGSLVGSSAVGSTLIAVQASVELSLTVKRPAPAPVFTSQPQAKTGTTGSSTSLSAVVDGSSVTYVWQKDGVAIAGATTATLTLDNLKLSDAGSYSVTATNSGGTVASASAILTVVTPVIVTVPSVATAPASATVIAGNKSTFTVTASGTAPFTYQWSRNGTTLPGATSSSLTVDSTLLADAGSYTVAITNSAGTVTSAAATLTVTPISRLSNLSVLSTLSGATDNFTLGYVVGGAGTGANKPFVVRAVGPALVAFGIGDPLADPKIELFTGSTSVTENDNWGGLSSLTTAFTGVGAFPFASPTSKDAAVLTSISTRDNSVKVTGTGAGSVLAEVYDASPDATFVSTTPRLLNVSVRKHLGDGLTVGFTIAGSASKTVLIRAVGPTLGDFGVTGTVADPQLVLFNGSSVKIGENDNWGGTAALTTAFTNVGAFALPAASKDSALLATLPPGSYSVQVSGVNKTTGVSLVEVYEVP